MCSNSPDSKFQFKFQFYVDAFYVDAESDYVMVRQL
jgi:hypothetical protein